jgi:hypothetical protein
MASRRKLPVEAQLMIVEQEVRELLNQIKNGEPEVYVMGNKYPECRELMTSGDISSNWLTYAIFDLKKSKERFHPIANDLRTMANDLLEIANVLDGRDSIVDIDIARAEERLESVRVRSKPNFYFK